MDIADIPTISGLVNISDFPSYGTSGIYFLLDEDEIVYIGQSRDIRRRIGLHLSDGCKRFNSIRFFKCSRARLDHNETRLIAFYRPKYNIVGVRGLVAEHTESSLNFHLTRLPRKRRKEWLAV